MLSELLSDLRYRMRSVFHRAALDRELTDELETHIAHETDKLVRSGMPHDEALRRARLVFGGVERMKDDTRDSHGTVFVDALLRDVRYALRGLRLKPGFTAAVVITLGLGVGVNAAMFGVLDRLLLRPPDYVIDPSRVNRVYVGWTENREFRYERSLEYLRYLDFTRWTTAFDAHAAFSYRAVAVGEGDDLAPRTVGVVSASYFDFFNARPVVGRFFDTTEDAVPRGASVAVITREYWQAQYGGRANVLGSTIRIEGTTYIIIGVAPKGFTGISDLDTPVAFIPITALAPTVDSHFYDNYGWSWLNVVVRRKPGVSLAAATADLTNAYERSWNAERARGGLAPIDVAKPRALAGHIQLGRGPLAGPEARVVVWTSGVAVLVLLIACANVANLLLVRSLRRRRELALRSALGGTRARLVQQLLTETIVLAFLGGVVGVAAAQWGGRILQRAFLDARSGSDVIADTRTLVFAAIMTIGTALIAGLVPAFQHDVRRMSDSLKAGSRDGAYAQSRARSVLLVFQAALSVVLLVGAGLFVRSLREIHALRLGYDVDPLIVASVTAHGLHLSDTEQASLLGRMLDELKGLPGVVSVSPAVTIPFASSEGRGLRVPGIDSVRKLGRFTLQIGSPDYFSTMGTRILRGRGFTRDDRADAPYIAIVSEAMAQVLWPGRDAVGQCIKIGADTSPCRTVVGIAENIRTRGLTGAGEFHYYLPITQFSSPPRLVIRVNGRGADVVETVRHRLQRLLPGSAYVDAAAMSRIMEPQLRSWQFGATMFVAFGGLALALAAIGLYAVVAFAVAQRTHELGLRIALGAQVKDVLRLVVGQGLGLAITGVVIGFAIALTAGARVSPLLYRVSARDPVTYAIVAAILIVVAVAASVIPAMRASRVDPNVALRAE